jgi:MFS family permease
MLGGAFAAFTVGAGLMHSYTVFLVAFIEEFRWSRAETSVAYAVSQLVAGASSPLVGVLVDRLGPRRLLLLGGSLLVLGLLGSAFISALWQIILLYGMVMTIGANCLGLVVFVPLLSRHFVRRRGMAISIVQSANGFGRAASAPLVQLLISSVGWRHTYLAQRRLRPPWCRCSPRCFVAQPVIRRRPTRAAFPVIRSRSRPRRRAGA